jgi:GNAT superfamily N-acetyltransferase
LDPACSTAVRALEHDPFYRSICAGHERDALRRRSVLVKYFDYSIQEGRELGRCVHLSDRARGVSVWLLPRVAEVDRQAARKKRAFLDATLDRRGCANYYRIIDYMHSRTATVVGADAWYLSIVAVDPAVQGQGFGRKLLEPTLAEADTVSATCYLETFSPRNIGFYQCMGFSTQAQFSEPTTGVNYSVMVRRPTCVETKP